MTGSSRRLRAGLAFLLLAFIVASPVSAAAARPFWLPGFPVRATGMVALMWSPVPGATGYRLLKRVDRGDWREAWRGSANAWTDIEAEAGAALEYRVVPVVAGGDGEPSDPFFFPGEEPLVPPVIDRAEPGDDSVVLHWTVPPGAVSFRLFASERRNGPFREIASVEGAHYEDREARNRRTRHYQLLAVDRYGKESARSATVSRTPGKGVRKALPRDTIRRNAYRGEDGREFANPFDLRLNGDGELMVLDRNGIQVLGQDGTFRRRIPLKSRWSRPSSLVPDGDGTLLLTFHAEGILRKIDGKGKLLRTLSYPPPANVPKNSYWNNPNMVAVDGAGKYWIADSVRGQIVKLDPAVDPPKTLALLGRPDSLSAGGGVSGDPGLALVDRVYYDSRSDRIYAGVPSTAEIVVIDPATNEIMARWGGKGRAADRFQQVASIAFRDNGNVLVFDGVLGEIQEFTGTLDYLATYRIGADPGRPQQECRSGDRAVFVEKDLRFFVLSPSEAKVCVIDLSE